MEYRGPVLRVLGGPGTGKTLVAVETVVAAAREGWVAPERCLVLAATRLAAADLRDRVTARLADTVTEPLARTHQGFGYAVLRAEAALRGDPAPRLLSGPEQDHVLRELLSGHEAGAAPAPAWPEKLRAALGTRGFRDEIRDLVMRAAEHGVDSEQLAALGAAHRRPEWVAAAQVLREYDEVTALSRPGSYDPAWLLTAAADLLEDDPDALTRTAARIGVLVVDDAQELTSAGARLVAVLHHAGVPVRLLGDPDTAVQTFRGADPDLIAHRWTTKIGDGPTVVLRRSHRQPAALRAVSARVAARTGAAGGGAQRAALPTADGGAVDVALLRSSAQEARHVAATLREAHLLAGVAWQEMAVVVRGQSRAATIRRVLSGAGVPVAPPSGDIPVRDEAAVRPLLTLLRLALERAADPEAPLDAADIADLLGSRVGGADAVTLRRLRRTVRRHELRDGGGRTSDELLAAAAGDPLASEQAGPDGLALRRITRALLAGVGAAQLDPAGGGWRPDVTAEGVLWAIWSALGVSATWRAEALRGGPRGERADRDLDAVLALFGAAAAFADRLPGAGPQAFLDHVLGQDVPGDTIVPRAPVGDRVAVVTPAAAAGREWRVVAVVGVQEGVWPDLRMRGALLGSQHLADVVTGRVDGAWDPVSSEALLAARAAARGDEARLFHVAVSRASQRLLVTAVRGEQDQPSPFLDLVDPRTTDGEADGHERGAREFTAPAAPLTLPSLVGLLRRDAAGAVGPQRERAAVLLAWLAERGVTSADPATWWGAIPAPPARPRREPGRAVRVAPSGIESHETCPLRWLLRSCGGDQATSRPSSIGILVHDVLAAADGVDGDAEALVAELDRRWARLGLAPGWVSERSRSRAHTMLRRAAEYVASSAFRPVGVEVDVDVTLGRARLRGRVDRLEADDEGRLRVVDYKTGSSKPRGTELARHPQLGAYQAAVESGGFAQHGAASAGAALLHLGRAGDVADPAKRLQRQAPLAQDTDPGWAARLVTGAAEAMAGATFPAIPGPACRRCASKPCCPAQPEGRSV